MDMETYQMLCPDLQSPAVHQSSVWKNITSRFEQHCPGQYTPCDCRICQTTELVLSVLFYTTLSWLQRQIIRKHPLLLSLNANGILESAQDPMSLSNVAAERGPSGPMKSRTDPAHSSVPAGPYIIQ
jgi:hypothetical protein